MRFGFAHVVLPLLISLLLVGCEKGSNAKMDPPIQLEVIAPAIESQLVSEIGDRFVKVGKVEYRSAKDRSTDYLKYAADLYLVEVYYMDEGHEKRCVVEFEPMQGDSSLLTYQGIFQLDLLSEYRSKSDMRLPLKIDVMMNDPKI